MICCNTTLALMFSPFASNLTPSQGMIVAAAGRSSCCSASRILSGWEDVPTSLIACATVSIAVKPAADREFIRLPVCPPYAFTMRCAPPLPNAIVRDHCARVTMPAGSAAGSRGGVVGAAAAVAVPSWVCG